MNKEFRLPDVGEGLTEADIVSWHVKPGDTVTINQVIVEIETAKAVVELPSPYAGTVSALLVAEGQTVDVGIPIITIDVPVAGEAPTADTAPAGGSEAGAAAAEPQPPAAAATPPRPLASRFSSATASSRAPPAAGRGRAADPARLLPGLAFGTAQRRSATRCLPPGTSAPSQRPARPASPPRAGRAFCGRPPWDSPPRGSRGRPPGAGTRPRKCRSPRRIAEGSRLARDLGIDLTGLTGSGPKGRSPGRMSRRRRAKHGPFDNSVFRGAVRRPAPRRRAQPGVTGAAEERIPVRGVRKHTAAAMVASAFTAPHVTEFLQVDVTETMAAVRRARELPEFAGVKVSPLLFVAKALLVAVRRHPMINSSWDEAAQEIVVKRPVNLGIAVAAERGLLVPNVKGAHALAAGRSGAGARRAGVHRAGRARRRLRTCPAAPSRSPTWVCSASTRVRPSCCPVRRQSWPSDRCATYHGWWMARSRCGR